MKEKKFTTAAERRQFLNELFEKKLNNFHYGQYDDNINIVPGTETEIYHLENYVGRDEDLSIDIDSNYYIIDNQVWTLYPALAAGQALNKWRIMDNYTIQTTLEFLCSKNIRITRQRLHQLINKLLNADDLIKHPKLVQIRESGIDKILDYYRFDKYKRL